MPWLFYSVDFLAYGSAISLGFIFLILESITQPYFSSVSHFLYHWWMCIYSLCLYILFHCSYFLSCPTEEEKKKRNYIFITYYITSFIFRDSIWCKVITNVHILIQWLSCPNILFLEYEIWNINLNCSQYLSKYSTQLHWNSLCSVQFNKWI